MSSATGDFHLQRHSPCADAGLLLPWMTSGTVDLDGARRVQGGVPDMGAYEQFSMHGTMIGLR